MPPVEEVVEEAQIDVDGMSNEELDSFIDDMMEDDPTEVTTDEGTVIEEEADEEIDDDTEVPDVTTDVTEDVVPDAQEVDTEVVPDEVEEEVPVVDEVDAITAMKDSIYEDLFVNGIKASGSNRTVRDAEHLKTLVRIGFSANENNRKVKPYMKQLKSLEQAGVSLEDGNLNFIVELMDGNEDALKELVTKRHKVSEDVLNSWLDGDEDTHNDYVPQDHIISDSRFQLEGILEDIKTSPNYGRTVDFLGTFDDDGKKLVSENPELVNLLHDDMTNGYFDKAMDEAQYRMDSGKLPKQSILQAYIQVMQDEQFYSTLTGSEPTKETPQAPKDNKEVIARKKKASTTPTTRGSNKKDNKTQLQSGDVAKMSNKEFDDFFNSLEVFD